MTATLTSADVLRSALRRTVRQLASNRFLVSGDPEWHEERDIYVVRWMPETDTYYCTCEADGCMHKAAVAHRRARDAARELLARKPAPTPDSEPTPPPARDSDHPPLPSDPILNPTRSDPPLPDWVQSFRRQQWEAVDRVAECFDQGAKVVMLQAPVGSGKTLTAEAVGRILDVPRLYIATTKTLQDQAARDFPYAAVLKGRANYPTLAGGVRRDGWGRVVAAEEPGGAVTAADCTATAGSPCRFCDPVAVCPYRVARNKARQARLAILNTAYFLTDANKGGRNFTGRGLAIMDEADLLEGELLNQAEVVISQSRMKRLRMAPPPKKTVESTWGPWVVEEAIPAVRERLRDLPPFERASTRDIRERKGLVELLERLEVVADELMGESSKGWVYDGYKQGHVVFRPIEVSRWGRMLWPHAERFLLMSGSIISADEMASSLGLEGEYRLVDVPMTFPAANRPVNIVALAEVTSKNQEQSWPKIAKGLLGVLALHPDDRILVHTVSYPMARFLMSELWKVTQGKRALVTYDRASERDEALARYKDTPGAVLVAPSMDRGIDLPGDLCRVVVIAKIPYPNLGDKRTAARLYGTSSGQAWYAVNTVRTLVQMTGRGVRGMDDHAVAYVLDHTFTTNVWKKNKALLPGWWCDAVNWRYPVHRLLKAGQGSGS